MAAEKRKPLPASARKMLPGVKVQGSVDPDERIEVTVMVRPKTSRKAAAAHTAQTMLDGRQLPEKRQYLTREQLADQRGASPDDFDKIEQFAHENNLTVTMTSIPQRIIKLSGTIADLTSAFKAKLKQYKAGKMTFRGRTGTLSVPDELADIIVGVYGFDTRPAARPHFRVLGRTENIGRKGAAARARKVGGPRRKKKREPSVPELAPHATTVLKPFTAPEVARLYNFPGNLDGSGQCIAIIELNTPNDQNQLGTGYTVTDLKAYFNKLNLPMPTVTAVGVGGGANLPNINKDSDVEVMLDIEVAGAVAPGAEIAVYFAPNTGQGFIDVVSAAVHDNVRKPSVVSISWGGPEDEPFTTEQLRDGLAQILQDAATLGVTVCCASGDNGSSDLPLVDEFGNPLRDGNLHVDFPASSPFALACGGTTLTGSGSTISSEVVWNEGDPLPHKPSGSGGGGVSNLYPRPAYQANAQVPKSPKQFSGRGVPDVSGNADSATGYLCKLAAAPQPVPVGGTSAVAPLWAGLIALINQRLAKVGKPPAGFINPIIYNLSGAFRDISQGNNDIDGTLNKYKAGNNWDPCTGLGTPDGTKLMTALGG